MDVRDDLIYLGSSFFKLVRQAARRDLAEAREFFGLPIGQAAYILSAMADKPLEDLASYGLPYRVANVETLLLPGESVRLGESFHTQSISQLSGWQMKAFELASEHWWITRDWAKRDLNSAAVLCGLKTRAEALALRDLRARDIKAMAAASYTRLMMEGSLGLQTALLLSDAEAAADRVTVARCTAPLIAA